MRISVVISTYNQPAWLEKVLWGYAYQTHRNFELIVADDGSTAATAVLLERLGRELALDIVHVWHQDRGFRKCEILNRALGERLENLGFRGVRLRHRAPVLHLEHGRPYVEQSVLKRNRAIRDRIAREREVRAVVGIEELHAANEPVVTRRLRGDTIR